MLDLKWYELTWVTTEMQNYLAWIQDNQELISWEYVTNPLNPNFKEMIAHLYPWQEERFKILNAGTFIAGLVDDKISSYVWTPEDSLKYRIDYDKMIETLLTTGYFMLKLYSTEAEGWKVEAVDGQKYYYDWVTEYFIEQYKIETKNPLSGSLVETKYYLYVQSFTNNVLTNRLFEIQKNSLSYWKPVKLDTIPELAWRPDQQIIMETDRLVYTLKVEYSIIKKIKSLIYSIERKWMEADKQFQNYMEQFTVFNNIEIPVDARKTVYQDWVPYVVTDFAKLGKIVETDADNWSGDIKIIKNWNDLIKEALEFSERQLRQISAITDIPPIFLGLDSQQWNDSGTSIVKSSGWFYKRIERYRKWIENVFYDVGQVIKTLANITFVWDPIVTSDPTEVLDAEIKKIDAWLSSKKMSIMKINWVDEVEAAKILEEIQAEKKQEAELIAWTIPAADSSTGTIMDTVS